MQPQSPQQQPATPGWQYNPEQSDAGFQPQTAPKAEVPSQAVSWSASEFIAHQKNAGWYGILALAGVVGATLIYLLTRDMISAVMVIVVAVALGALAGRKPRTLQYQIDNQGLQIGEKFYSYGEFKSFSVIDEGALSSIRLLPLKRLMPPLSVYYDPQDEDRITSILAAYMPFEEGEKDAVDRFMHRIRF